MVSNLRKIVYFSRYKKLFMMYFIPDRETLINDTDSEPLLKGVTGSTKSEANDRIPLFQLYTSIL